MIFKLLFLFFVMFNLVNAICSAFFEYYEYNINTNICELKGKSSCSDPLGFPLTCEYCRKLNGNNEIICNE